MNRAAGCKIARAASAAIARGRPRDTEKLVAVTPTCALASTRLLKLRSVVPVRPRNWPHKPRREAVPKTVAGPTPLIPPTFVVFSLGSTARFLMPVISPSWLMTPKLQDYRSPGSKAGSASRRIAHDLQGISQRRVRSHESEKITLDTRTNFPSALAFIFAPYRFTVSIYHRRLLA